MDPIIVVSADGHAGGDIEVYREYIEERCPGAFEIVKDENERYTGALAQFTHMSDETLDAIDGRAAIRGGGIEAVLDPQARLAQLDAEGIAAEVLFPGHQAAILPLFSAGSMAHPAELRDVGSEAYHRYLADVIAAGAGRFVGVGNPGSCHDMDRTVAELHWMADHGIRSVGTPLILADEELPPLVDPYFSPFWDACAERGLILSVHAGWGARQGFALEFFEQMRDAELFEHGRDMMDMGEDSPLTLDLGPRRAMWQLMLAGVFDRHPDLKLVLTEIRADWLPRTLAHLDAEFERRRDLPLTMKPSEYFARNCLIAPSSPHRAEIAMRHEIGVDRLMFGSDYPHTEGTWPNTRDWIRDAFAGVPEAEARRILGENAIECYGFDRATLATIAADICPSVEEVLGEHQVDPRIVDHFDVRAGYRREAERVDTDAITNALDEDVLSLARAGS
jgi:predicted TIM-barrel fold metal-dependent hydrolase